jgi:formamidopyrimidine-DNA glycosylase
MEVWFDVPELPDIVVYVERLEALVGGRVLEGVRLQSPFLLRTAEPPLAAVEGRRVVRVSRLGKRILLGLEADLALVIHLMMAGRLRWRKPGAAVPKGNGLAALDFETGTLLLTEAGRKRQASLHVIRGAEAPAQFDRGGLEVLQSDPEAFREAVRRENHTLKRALTDQRILSGIGNAYSDEILWRARLSPFKQTRSLSDGEMTALFQATRSTLEEWTRRLREEAADGFPEKVTAFRPGMGVHGRYREPCPACGTPIQRIVYAGKNESNYCPGCQTGGRLLADRALSRLLKASWPRSVEELEGR